MNEKKSKPKPPKLHCSHAQSLLLPLLCRRPICAHMKNTKKRRLVQLIFQTEKERENLSLKFAVRNQSAIFFITFYFSLRKSQEDCSSWFTKRKIKVQMQAYKSNWFKCKHRPNWNITKSATKQQGKLLCKNRPNSNKAALLNMAYKAPTVLHYKPKANWMQTK